MRFSILALLLSCVVCVSVKAQTVIGPGSARMSKPVGVCKWNTNPACNFTFKISNPSRRAVIRRIEFRIAGLSEIDVSIQPGETKTFEEVPMIQSVTAEILLEATRIYTVREKKK